MIKQRPLFFIYYDMNQIFWLNASFVSLESPGGVLRMEQYNRKIEIQSVDLKIVFLFYLDIKLLVICRIYIGIQTMALKLPLWILNFCLL